MAEDASSKLRFRGPAPQFSSLKSNLDPFIYIILIRDTYHLK